MRLMMTVLSLGLATLMGCGTEDTTEQPGEETSRETYPASGYGTTEGSILPNLSFVESDGNPFTMERVFKDTSRKIMLISTTAGWCSACVEEQPKLEALHKEFAADGLQVMVAMFEDANTNAATTENAKDWKDNFDLTFPVVADSPFVLGDFYNSELTPMTMLVEVGTMKILSIDVGFDESATRAIIEAKL